MTLYQRIESEHLNGEGQYLAGYFRTVDLPVLQPVTPEAMAELESREVIGVLFVDGYGVQVASYNRYRGWWWCGGIGKLDRPTRGWFIELSTIPEGRT